MMRQRILGKFASVAAVCALMLGNLPQTAQACTGIRLVVTEPAALCQGDVLDDLHFEFAGRSFRCRADVRNVDVENGTVGAAFVDLPRLEQRALERIIAQLQRQRAQQFAGVLG